MAKQTARRRSRSLEVKQRRMGYVFVAPLIVGMLAFVAFPVIQSLFFSFSKLNVVASGYKLDFLGIENYRYIFAVDPDFRTMVIRSLRDMLINVPVVILFSFFCSEPAQPEIPWPEPGPGDPVPACHHRVRGGGKRR